MMGLHVYTERLQPATCWTDRYSGKPLTIRWPQDRLLWTRCCGLRRRAKNCVVQSYYDALMVWCAEGKGCKGPKVIAAKQRREFRHRSVGQKARRKREKERP